MSEAEALDALAATLSLLTDNPYDLSLHIRHVQNARETGMDDQVEMALDMLVAYWAAEDEVWIPLIDIKVKNTDLNTADGVTSVVELFEKAEADYLSIPILKKHMDFVLERFAELRESETKPTELEELLTPEWVRSQLDAIVSKGVGHLGKGQQLWMTRHEWEMEQLEEASEEAKPQIISRIESLLLEHLKQPHSENDETLQAYSSFTTSHRPPDQYEALLVQASKSRAQALKAYQRRERYETSLAQAGDSLDGYAYYLEYEKKSKKPELAVLSNLYERALAQAAKNRFGGDANAEFALRTFWGDYLDLLRAQELEQEDLRAATYKRATRSVPGSGDVWARYIRYLERTGRGDEVDATYSTSLSINSVTSDVEQIIPIVLAKASFERRRVETDEMGNEGYEGVLLPLLEAQTLVREKTPAGDPRLRLEKYFSSLCLDIAELPQEAFGMWSATVRHYKSSYLAWTGYTDMLIRLGMYDEARKAFRDVANKNLDWPEAIWEAWTAFEHVHGSIEELEDCVDRIERARRQVNTKRAKDAERAVAEQQASSLIAETATRGQDSAAQHDVAMEVDQAPGAASEGSTKRKAHEDLEPEASKKVKIEPSSAPLKRDRENCAVFVADLPSDATEDDLKGLFKDCGSIREIKLTPLANALVATIEFAERDSVPAALTKDKKRVREVEVAVHLAWRSTLYVTNFPESTDDKAVRDLFGKYGILFDVRWPSKKFKNSRRFCYVQFTSPGEAQAALELHGKELEPGLPLSVLISNPERKKERTDNDANDREIYVAGLARSVTKHDMEKLFATYGTIKDIRITLDDKGHTKGFAFVEFEQEKDAQGALAANNFELKKRRIAVTLADTRAKNSKTRLIGKRPLEVRNRSVRVRGLPANTQEGLLQQVLEKYARVQRVEVFQGTNEAIAELENPAEAGKLLLHPEPITYNGETLRFTEESLEAAPNARASRPGAPAPQATSGLFMPRSAASRPRAGLGSKKARTVVSAAGNSTSSASTSKGGSAAKGQDDFRKMLGGA